MSRQHESSPSLPGAALSAQQVERFVEQGFVLLREAIPPAMARKMVEDTLRRLEPMPRVTRRNDVAPEPLDPREVDFWAPRTWGSPELTVETRRSLSIARYAPKLWGAVQALVGPGYSIRRETFGEQWILNGNLGTGRETQSDVLGLKWHIDAPSQRTRLDGRTDAVALLILWSDVEPGGGGTLYSGESLGHVVRLLEERSDGVDTTNTDWVADIIARCGDVRELTGRAGDVLIIHSLALHAAQKNLSGALRVLENPMIEVRAPLRYAHDNPAPSPVEQSVLRRLRFHRSMPREPDTAGPRPPEGATADAPTQVEQARARRAPTQRRVGLAIDPPPRWLVELVGFPPAAVTLAVGSGPIVLWVTDAEGHVTAIQLQLPDHPSAGRATRCLMIRGGPDGKKVSAPIAELDRRKHQADIDAFARRSRWLMSVWLGAPSSSPAYTPTEREWAQARVLRQAWRLSAEGSSATPESAPSMPGDDLVEAFGIYVLVARGDWSALFALDRERLATQPLWLRALVAAVEGRVEELAALAAVSPEGPPGWLDVVRGLVLQQAGHGEAARRAFLRGAPHVRGPERGDVMLHVALACHEAGHYEQARGAAREAAVIHGEDGDKLLQVAQRQCRIGAYDDALQVLERACRLRPSDPEPLTQYATLLLWAADTDRAERVVRRLVELEPEAFATVRLQGIVATLGGGLHAAAEHFERARALRPEDAEVLTWLTEVRARRGEVDAAEATLEASRAHREHPVHDILQAFVRERDEPSRDARLVRLAESLGMRHELPPGPLREAQAADVLARLLAPFGGNRTTPATIRSLEEDRGPGSPGLRRLELPAADDVLSSRSASAEQIKRVRTLPVEQVLQGFARLAQRYPTSPHPRCYLGELRLWLGDYDGALREFDRIPAGQKARWAYVGRAAVHVLRGDGDAALREIARCYDKFDPVAGATTHVYLGELYRRRGDLRRAREHLEEAVAAKPGRLAAWMNLALVHRAAGDTAAAREILARVHRAVPRLLWDARESLASDVGWPVGPDSMELVFERALAMMRGNRSSHTITYFDAAGRFRVAPDARPWVRSCRRLARYIAKETESRLGEF